MPYIDDFPHLMAPGPNNRANRMLDAGQVRVTVTSKATGQHITVRFKASAKRDGRWTSVPLADASHVFVEVPNASDTMLNDKIGTFYPDRGSFYRDDNCSDARYWAALNAARWLLHDGESGQATYLEEERCGRCARPLTDPVSIERGIGPDCYGAGTGSQHEVKHTHTHEEAQMSLEVKPSTPSRQALTR